MVRRKVLRATAPATPGKEGHIGSEFWEACRQEGCGLVELFGGIAPMLEALALRGVHVHSYVYVESEEEVRKIARRRVGDLRVRFPALLGKMEVTWLKDVREVKKDDLRPCGLAEGTWMVAAGPPCTGMSHAGRQRGMDDPGSALARELRRVLLLARKMASRSLAHVVEMAFDFRLAKRGLSRGQWELEKGKVPERVREDAETFREWFGPGVEMDSAAVGGYSHRLRFWFTNLADSDSLQGAVELFPSPDREVNHILSEGETAAVPATVPGCDRPSFVQRNVAGKPLRALPTIMRREASHNWKGEGLGVVTHVESGTSYEPGPLVKERALGYPDGATAARGVVQRARSAALGNSWCLFSVVGLLALSEALRKFSKAEVARVTQQTLDVYGKGFIMWQRLWDQAGEREEESEEPRRRSALSPVMEPGVPRGRRGVGWNGERPSAAANCRQDFVRGAQFYNQTVLVASTRGLRDPYKCERWMGLLKGEVVDPAEEQRYARELGVYRYAPGTAGWCPVTAVLEGSSSVLYVPKLEDWERIIRERHGRAHTGVDRTMGDIALTYYWPGVREQVRGFVRACEFCSRLKAKFGRHATVLQSLPITTVGYRWHVDLADFNSARSPYKWLMVAVCSFSKWVELAPLKDKEAATVFKFFFDNVICRHGSPADVVMDQGREFAGVFEKGLKEHGVNVRKASASHPQSNGMAERTVATVKQAIQRLCLARADLTWETFVPQVALAMRIAKHAGTGMSPFEIVYAAKPVMDGRAHEASGAELPSGDDVEGVKKFVLERLGVRGDIQDLFVRNQQVAQFRDQALFRERRSSAGAIRLGDWVFLKQDSLDMTREGETLSARPTVLRVMALTPSQVAWLMGACGHAIPRNVWFIAKCPEGTVGRGAENLVPFDVPTLQCTRCGLAAPDVPADPLVLCEARPTVAHERCVPGDFPAGRALGQKWRCPRCRSPGMPRFRMHEMLVRGRLGSDFPQMDEATAQEWVRQRVARVPGGGGLNEVGTITKLEQFEGAHGAIFREWTVSFMTSTADEVWGSRELLVGLKRYKALYTRGGPVRRSRRVQLRQRPLEQVHGRVGPVPASAPRRIEGRTLLRAP